MRMRKDDFKLKEKALSQKENLFCTYYSIKRNAVEAALRSGYTIMPEKAAVRLLRKEGVRKRIAALSKENRTSFDEVEAGLRRIAFGCVGDAVKIALSENFDTEELKDMDLFGISEIKVTRGKGVEIKFFDRIKALEKLSQLAKESGETVSDSFFRAIEDGAQALRSGCDEDR